MDMLDQTAKRAIITIIIEKGIIKNRVSSHLYKHFNGEDNCEDIIGS